MRFRFGYVVSALFMFMCACTSSAQNPPRRTSSAQTASAADLYAQGVALAELGDYTRAEQYLLSALRAGHDGPLTTRALVTTCVRAGRLRSAIVYAANQLAETPRDVPLRRMLGTLYWALGEREAAARELRQVLRLADDDAESHYMLALVLRMHDPKTARAHFARYLALAPEGRHAEEARDALVPVEPS